MSEQFIARMGDKIRCPDGSTAEILDNDCCMEIGGKKVARLGDKTSHGGKIITAASTTTAESNKTFVHISEKAKVTIGKNVHFGKRVIIKNTSGISNVGSSQANTSSAFSESTISSASDQTLPSRQILIRLMLT